MEYLNKEDFEVLEDFIGNPDKYVYTFAIKEKNKIRNMLTYNKGYEVGEYLKKIHSKVAKSFTENFYDRNENSYAYQKEIGCKDALKDHMKSNYFIKLDIHHFFESITQENFFNIYGDNFNKKWTAIISGCFYKHELCIGFITSPVLSNYFMSKFDKKITKVINENSNLHYSRYCDDILISSEMSHDKKLEELFELIKVELKNLGLELNTKKTKIVNLDLESKNSLSFLGLNLSKKNEIDNKITISKNYILFLLFLIEKNNKYQSRCKGLVDEINSRVAYLAYNSPISFARFQKKHINKFGYSYNFVPKKFTNRLFKDKIEEIYDYNKYLDKFKINMHISKSYNNALVIKDGIELERYRGDEEVVVIPPFVNSIGFSTFSNNTKVKKIILNDKLKYIDEYAFSGCTNLETIEFPDSLQVINSRAFEDCTSLKDVTIPKKVKMIGEEAFKNSGLENITLQEGLIEIEDFAFNNCTNLKEIELPNTLEKLGNFAFSDCKNLENVKLSENLIYLPTGCFENCIALKEIDMSNVLTIGDGVFKNCSSIKKIYVPKNLVNISFDAFDECKNIEEIKVNLENKVYDSRNNCNSLIKTSQNELVLSCINSTIPDDIEKIGPFAFANRNITKLDLPNTLKEIGEEAFSNCLLLKEVNFPDSLIDIKKSAFENCISLKDIKLSDNIKVIRENIFKNCYRIENIKLPKYLEEIEDYAFANNNSLKSIKLPETLLKVGYKSFSNCYSIKELNIPANLELINDYSFTGLPKNIDKITVDRENMYYTSGNNTNTLIERKNNKIILGCKNSIIKNGVEKISTLAFAYCKDLKYIDFPETLKYIDSFAFQDCKSLLFLDFKNIVKIDASAFSGCDSLITINFPSSLTELGEGCFKNCRSLKDLYLPQSLVKSQYEAFGKCSNIENIYIPQQLNSIDFNNEHLELENIKLDKYSKKYIYDKECNVLLERKTLKIVLAGDNCKIPEYTKIIGQKVFANKNITSIEIPENVKKIESSAFSNCKKLKEVIFKGTNVNLGESVFRECIKLENIELPKNLKSISVYTFDGCKSLKNIKLPSVLTYIQEGVFYNCTSLTDIVIPYNVNKLGKEVFYNCKNLKNVTLSERISYIPAEAFAYCESLEKINIPAGLKEISPDAFNNCNNLKEFEISSKNKCFDHNYNNMLIDIKNKALILSIDNKEIPNYVQYIGVNAFSNNKKMTKITIPNSVKHICKGAFMNCTNLKEVTLSNKLTIIENSTFLNCKALEKILIPDSISKISYYAFENCVNLKEVILSNKLIFIGTSAFRNCESLDTINLPPTVSFIDISAFENCYGLKETKLPEKLENISTKLFRNCINLERVNIPNEIEEIGSFAFSNCKKLNEIKLPNTLKVIKENAFENCTTLKELFIPVSLNNLSYTSFLGCNNNIEKIIVDKNNQLFDSRNNCNAIITKKDNELLFGCKNTKIDDSVEVICTGALCNIKTLKKLIIPSNVKIIHSQSISNNKNLKEIYIPKNTEYIATTAFSNDINIEKIEIDEDNLIYRSSNTNSVIEKSTNTLVIGCKNTIISENVKNIGEFAFINGKLLNKLFIPKTVFSIKENSFYGCNNLKEIIVDKDNPIYDSRNNCNAIVQTKSNKIIKACINTVIDKDIKSLGDFSYNGLDDLKSMYIPEHITAISSTAFNNCKNLKNIKVDENNMCYKNDKKEINIISKSTDKTVLSIKDLNTLMHEHKRRKKSGTDFSDIVCVEDSDDVFNGFGALIQEDELPF